MQSCIFRCNAPIPDPPTTDNCPPAKKIVYATRCSLLNDTKGPFKECIPHVNPAPYLRVIVF